MHASTKEADSRPAHETDQRVIGWACIKARHSHVVVLANTVGGAVSDNFKFGGFIAKHRKQHQYTMRQFADMIEVTAPPQRRREAMLRGS